MIRYGGVMPTTGESTDRGGPKAGRPRSDRARVAVLEAVDDLLVEQGYSALTMKGIAERAGVGRQTVYRWWSTKAEVLLEACIDDARVALATQPQADALHELTTFLDALSEFLVSSDAGRAYRALVGEAQQDTAVRDLLAGAEPVTPAAVVVLERVRGHGVAVPEPGLAAAQLTGPVLARALLGPTPLDRPALRVHASTLLGAWTRDA